MTNLTKDDIRAAVAAGIMSEAQAASTLALADTRRGMRENLDGLDEPFELFRGFNEIFIVFGLGILFTGYLGVFTAIDSEWWSFNIGILGLPPVILLSRYFILKRSMVAPAIALTLMTAGLASLIGSTAASLLGGDNAVLPSVASATVATAMIGYWRVFQVPFALFVFSGAVFACVFSLAALSGAELNDTQDIFLLSGDGPFSMITIGLGLITLVFALRFDMSDPHRVTRRTANAFWLHIVAAPAITNTIALTLFQADTVRAQIALLAFVLAMALFSVVIDRRSFLISGIGYLVALAFTAQESGAFLIILTLGAVLTLGAGLVVLGAKWEAIRIYTMNALPNFPGKDRLAPWTEG